MRRSQFLRVATSMAAVAAAFPLAGCGGGGSQEAASPSSAPAAPPAGPSVQTFAYVTNQDSGDISMFEVAADGALNFVDSVPAEVGVHSIAIHPSGRFAYASSMGQSENILLYTVNAASGLLSPNPVGPFAATIRTKKILMHPSGKFMYALSGSDDTFGIYGIDQQTGALEELDRRFVRPDANTEDLQLNASGTFLFAVTKNIPAAPDSTVSSFAVEEDGLLRLIGSVDSGLALNAIAVAPAGNFLYVCNEDGTLFAHAVDSEGLLGPATTLDIGDEPGSIVISPSRRSAYVLTSDDSSSRVLTCSIHPQTGELTSDAAPIPLPGFVRSLATSPGGEFLYCTNSGGAEIYGFEINPADDALQPMKAPFATGISPLGITIVRLTG